MLRSYRESVIWKSLSILKGNQELETYDVLLFIITLHHFGYIDTAKDNADFINEIKLNTYIERKTTFGQVLFQLFPIYEKDLIAIGNENIRYIASTIEFSNFGNVSTEEFIKHFEEMLMEISSSNKQMQHHYSLCNDQSVRRKPSILFQFIINHAPVRYQFKYRTFKGCNFSPG